MTVKVLLVEDNPGDARLTREHLSEAPTEVQFDLTHAATLKDARQKLAEGPYDVVLLDLGLPDAVGLEALSQIDDLATGVPIVVLSGLRDEMLAVQAVRQGAQDYLVKGFGESGYLSRSILFAIERKGSERYLSHLAHYDGLTNIPNRRLLYDRLEVAIAHARRSREHVALMFLDLDRFKWINDTLGHVAGDSVLQGVGQRLRSCTRQSDTVARLGGDEFALMISEVARVEKVGALARKVLSVLDHPFILDGHEVRVTASMGISIYPGDGEDAEMLLKNADAAMYGAKRDGGISYRFYSAAMNARANERLLLASGLRHALDKGELLLHYLPTVGVRSGRTVGVEALVRWRNPVWGLLAPDDFIPLAEETGLIRPLEQWVIGEACRQVRAWSGAGSRRLRLGVNLSSRQVGRKGLYEIVGSALRKWRIEPGDLELDLIESGLVQSGERGQRAVERLRGMGVRIAIDDFGTASSLVHLKGYPVNTLKTDPAFIRDINTDGRNAVIHAAIISMAHGLGLEVSAEGVEREDQMTFLRNHHCDYAQGFYFGRPLPAAEMEAHLQGEWAAVQSLPGTTAASM